jgi:exonuclease SbcC
MIPHHLRLYHFMCYREEQTLDFSGIHLACLTGDNGHGKSALLDAITWALWGRARARRDDELITLGESEMWVELEFDLAGQRYRIWRQRSKKGRGQSDLHFYVWNPSTMSGKLLPDSAQDANDRDGGDWQLLDDGGLNERQSQIIRTLRLDYDTFINSSFLLQGRADSFTVKTAGERKQILADILGLSRYDLYEDRAKAEGQSRKERAGLVEGEIRAIERDLARRGDYEAQLSAARAAALVAADALRKAETERADCRVKVEGLRAQANQLADLRRRLSRAEAELNTAREQWEAARKRLAQIEAVLAHRTEIEAGWAALQRARGDDAAWNARLLRNTQFQERINRTGLAVSQARMALESDQRRLSDRHAELGRKIAAGKEQEIPLAQARVALADLDVLQARRDALAAELREVIERAAALKVESDRLKVEGQATKDKMQMMGATESAACPLCGQSLSTEHRDRMLAELDAERTALGEHYRANRDTLTILAGRKAQLEAEDADLARQLRARDARQRQAAQAEAAIADGQAAAEEQRRVTDQVAQVAARLAAEDYAPAERAELARLQAEVAELGYDAAAHEAVRAEIVRQTPFDARYQRQLLPALDGDAEARARVADLAAGIAQREAQLADDRAEVNRLAQAVADLPTLQAALDRATATVESAAAAERRARQNEGAAMQQLSALDALAERRGKLAADLDALNAEIGIYNQLREAFGKKGLQAMIIESAIPEVEAEANRLLGRMTEGRMSLRLETQREKVTGGVAETLDIIIADELGARSYELYSGGEAFRANLALRIAISKLLARRAGAQLQTLVIDEGFGSQDSKGRDLVVEAINSIQHDFERIIVITHIEELKDLFPARIDVVKTAAGSEVRIG